MDETFEIDAGIIDLPDAKDPSKKKRVELSSKDLVFQKIRNMHIAEVAPHLRTLINEIKMIQEVYN